MATDETEEDLYLSDVHIEQQDEQNVDVKSIRIEFSLPEESRSKPLIVDQDGDFERTSAQSHRVLHIEHEMETSLSQVGLQLWRASLFLSDFVLNNVDLVKDRTVIELGTGLGLVSFVASIYARLVFATDLKRIVKRAQANWIANRDVLLLGDGEIRFKCLDWFAYETFLDPAKEESDVNSFMFSKEDLVELSQASVILAADVIYDDILTIKFMNAVYKLLTYGERMERCCVVANEKRINFSTLTLSSSDTAYDYFMTCLNDLDGFIDSDVGYRFKVDEIKVDHDDLVKYVKSYNRNKFLYIWKITSIPI